MKGPVEVALAQGVSLLRESIDCGDSTSAAKFCGINLALLLFSACDLLTAAEATALEPAEHQLQQG